mgnify:CR=1 FL=1
MAIGESIDARLLRLDPQVFKSIESAGAATGAMYADLGESVSGVVKTYSDKKKELNLKKEEEEELLKEEKEAISYLVGKGMPLEEATRLVDVLGPVKSAEFVNRREDADTLVKNQRKAQRAAVKSSKEAAETAAFYAELRQTRDAYFKQQDKEIEHSQNLEIAFAEGKTNKEIEALRAALRVVEGRAEETKKTADAVKNNNQWLVNYREVESRATQPDYFESTPLDTIKEDYKTIQDAQVNYQAKEPGSSLYEIYSLNAGEFRPAWFGELEARARGIYNPDDDIEEKEERGIINWLKNLFKGEDEGGIGPDVTDEPLTEQVETIAPAKINLSEIEEDADKINLETLSEIEEAEELPNITASKINGAAGRSTPKITLQEKKQSKPPIIPFRTDSNIIDKTEDFFKGELKDSTERTKLIRQMVTGPNTSMPSADTIKALPDKQYNIFIETLEDYLEKESNQKKLGGSPEEILSLLDEMRN